MAIAPSAPLDREAGSTIYDAVRRDLATDPEDLPVRTHATYMAEHDHDRWLADLDARVEVRRASART